MNDLSGRMQRVGELGIQFAASNAVQWSEEVRLIEAERDSIRTEAHRLLREKSEQFQEFCKKHEQLQFVLSVKADECEQVRQKYEVHNINSSIVKEIDVERARQLDKFGIQTHDNYKYLAILGEEVGEANQAALQADFEGGPTDRLRKELVEVATVAIAFIEKLDMEAEVES